MRDHDYAASIDFLARFFSGTEHAVEIRALPVEAGAGRVWPLFCREPDLVVAHCLRWDALGRAVYFGTATRAGGLARGDRTHCRELVACWVDIDCYKQGITKEEAIAALLALPVPPSIVVDSGGGIHAYWLLREPIDISQGPPDWPATELRVVSVLKQLAGVLAGDLAVCDLARIMRLPGTHNTKDGTLRLCSVLPCSTWARVALDDLEDMLYVQRPLLVAPETLRPPLETNPWGAFAKGFSFGSNIDVEERLARMKYRGIGPDAIHPTQRDVTASMAARGVSDDESLKLVLAATHRAAAEAGFEAYWNWGREEARITRLIQSGEHKYAPGTGVMRTANATVVQLRTARGRLSPEAALPDDKTNDPPPAVAASGNAVGDLIALFNTRYMVVNEDGRAMIYEPAHDTRINRRYYLRISFDDLKKFHLNRRMEIGRTKKGEAIVRNLAEIWLAHPDRREYLGGVIFDPSNAAGPECLNLWQGFAVSPKAGKWELLKTHILDVICAGNADHFRFLLGWMARLVQFPARQGEIAVVMRGGEGAGKGTLARVLLRLLGQHGLTISNAKHLTGAFNGHLRDCVFLFADEAFWAGDKSHVGVLKALITEPFLTIEAKYQTPVQMPNYVHLMMASNEDWVVPAALDARRFFVLDVAPGRTGDHTYFSALWDEMEGGGYAALLFDLLNFPLTDYNPRALPITAGLIEQRKLSLAPIDEWWKDVLFRGYVYQSRLGLEEYFHEWDETVTTELLYKSYLSFSKERHERRPVSREWFGRYMVKQGGISKRPDSGVTGERLGSEANSFGGTTRTAVKVVSNRPMSYRLGDLDAAREAFCSATGLVVNWPVDPNEPPF